MPGVQLAPANVSIMPISTPLTNNSDHVLARQVAHIGLSRFPESWRLIQLPGRTRIHKHHCRDFQGTDGHIRGHRARPPSIPPVGMAVGRRRARVVRAIDVQLIAHRADRTWVRSSRGQSDHRRTLAWFALHPVPAKRIAAETGLDGNRRRTSSCAIHVHLPSLDGVEATRRTILCDQPFRHNNVPRQRARRRLKRGSRP
jgi:hypothetical protein